MGNDVIHTKHFIVKIKKKKKNRVKLFIIICFTMIFLCISCFSLMKILIWKADSDNTSKQTEEISNYADVEEVQDNENTELIEKDPDLNSDYWTYVKFPLISVNFDELKKKNSDTVAWVNVNNTNINYPVVQADDNSFYLNHSYNKEYNEAGWVFLDYRNKSDFSDRNTIIYAHSRLDKTMFGSLSKTLKQSWFLNKENHIIRISNEHENSLWQIFSIYVIETENYYITVNFSDDDYLVFLDKMKGRSIYNFNTNVGVNDRIVTLSTCYDDKRKTVVHAKLLKRELR